MSMNEENELLERIGHHYLKRRLFMEDYSARKLEHYGKFSLRCNRSISLDRLVDGVLKGIGLYALGKKEASRFECIMNSVSIGKLPSEFEGFRILQLSDLHLGPETDLMDCLLKHIASLEYDLCVITGDFNYKGGQPTQSALGHLEMLRSVLKGTIFATLGNHDESSLIASIEHLDIKLLLNECFVIHEGKSSLALYGVDDPHYFATDNWEKLRPLTKAHVHVLLSHSSELYREAERSGIDVLLAGHSHGGQLCLPGGFPMMNNAKAPRQLIAGAWRYGLLQGYTSKGSSVNSGDVRFLCRPEIVIHELQGAKE